MNLCRALLLFVFILGAEASWAGFERGNGGGGLLCATPEGQKLSAYDLHFGAIAHQLHFTQRFSDFSTWNTRIAQRNPYRSKIYGDWYKSFDAETQWTPPGQSLEPTPDFAVRYVPTGCIYVQIVVQSPEPHPLTGKRYTINTDLWKLLSEEDRIVLVTHELIYREALSTDPDFHRTAEPTIILNSMLHSDDLLPEDDQSRAALLSKLGFQLFESQGFAFHLFRKTSKGNQYRLPLSFWPDGSLKLGYMVDNFPKGVQIIKRPDSAFSYARTELSPLGRLQRLSTLEGSDFSCLDYSGQNLEETQIKCASELNFSENGLISSAKWIISKTLDLTGRPAFQGVYFRINPGLKTSDFKSKDRRDPEITLFFENDQPTRLIMTPLANPCSSHNQVLTASWRPIEVKSILTFNPDGTVRNARSCQFRPDPHN